MREAAKRLEQALEMWEDGVQIMRENLRRRMPDASESVIEVELDRWLAGPDPGDWDRVVTPRLSQE